ncbi:MAG: hypothetical protein AAF431_04010 [Pseudomonadota bacterium]
MKKHFFHLFLLVGFFIQGSAVQAKTVNVNCDNKSLANKLANLNKNKSHTVNVKGTCTEDLVITGFKHLTIAGNPTATLAPTVYDPADAAASTVTLTVEDSNLTLRSLTVNAGSEGIRCYLRSICDLEDVIVESGHNGMSYQDQSQGFIRGASAIQNSLGIGLGIFGASSVNLRPEPFPGGGPGPTISGHGSAGVAMLDGSFFRADEATISGNDIGILGRRNVIVKFFNGGGITGNTSDGISLTASSTGQLITDVTLNGGNGASVGTLSYLTVAGSTITANTGLSVSCLDSNVVVDLISLATIDSTNCP